MSQQSPSTELIPRPRPISRRGWWVILIIGVIVVSAYAMVVSFYNAEGSSSGSGGLGATDAPGIVVTIEPVAVDALTNRATVNLSFAAQNSDLTDESGRLTENTRIAVSSSLGTQEAKFTAGEPFGRFEATIGLDGEQAFYPFDDHSGTFLVSADKYARASDGSLTSTGDLPVGLQSTGGVSGWDITTDLPTQMDTHAIGTGIFVRAFSTRAFAILILLLASLLSIASAIVGVLVFTNRRKAEVALLSWAAALLFALPLLRSYLPNSPPIGAALDMYLYLWVMVAAVVGALLVVLGWLRQSRAAQVARFESEIQDAHNAT